jgi:cobalt-zinc-cadmium efflux system membrane fusion protein
MANRETAAVRQPRSYRVVVIGVVVLAIAAGVFTVTVTVPQVRGAISDLWSASEKREAPPPGDEKGRVELFRDAQGHPGLRLTAEAAGGHGIRPVAAEKATEPRKLPPQVGTINFDNDRLFHIRSRFPGELDRVMTVPEGSPTTFRPLRFGDRVKQGDLLAVVWSQQLGAAKAALVDAICAHKLSKDNYERLLKLWEEGVASVSALKAAERQLQGDSGAMVTAERSLRMWRLTEDEIKDVRAEANIIMDQKKVRDSKLEARWAWVELRVPTIPDDPKALLTVVEKNANDNMVDPINSPAPLFKLADLRRLQIYVHPPQEYLPILRDSLARAKDSGLPLKWDIRFKGEPPDAKAEPMTIVDIGPTIEPTQHTPIVWGYLDNSRSKHLVGQYVEATIYMPPVPDTVEIPADALNEVGGEALVFVEVNAERREYTLRRVRVEARFKDAVVVRSKLTAEDEKLSEAEQKLGRRPLQPLRAGERVLTRGVVELTRALEELLIEERIKAESN